MRLTLRTLLAYLDGILEPGDADDLAKKIEESEFATGLVHRIRDVMRRLRLGAPSLTDRGPGLDPNTVAEYLDNTLASDRVTDFEKVCLDSDIHLAEVAAGHQILTLVLGEPAEVDEASRQRMYDVQTLSSGTKPPPTLPASPAQAAASAPTLTLDLGDESGGRRPRQKPTVPEYLRERHHRPGWLPIAAAVVLAACVVVAVLKTFGQLEPGTPAGDMLVRWGVVAAPAPEVALKEPGKEEGDEGRGARDEGGETKAAAPGEQSATKPANTTAVEPSTETKGQLPPESTNTSAVPGLPPAAAVQPGATPPATAATPPNPKEQPTVTPAQLPPPATAPATVGPKAETKTTVERPVTPATNPGGEAVNPLAAPEPLGRLLSSDEQVLLCSDSSGDWTRVGANQMLIPQQLLALPTYRVKVGLTAGVTMEMLGGTRVELLGSTPQDLPGVRIMYGRAVLMPLGKAGSRLRVAFGDHAGTITFVNTEAVAALEVHRIHAPGTNPETSTSRVTADLLVAGGAILWEETQEKGDVKNAKGVQPVRLASPERLSFDGPVTGTPTAVKDLPKIPWIFGGEPITPLDRRASPAIAQGLPADRLARVGLLELATSRPQKEVKWLALRCLGYLGQFRDMAAALNDAEHRSDWRDYVDALSAAVDRDAETAAAVRMALEKQYPQQAADLYRMLWGFTDKQLEFGDEGKGGNGKGGDDGTLVEWLSDDLLAVRVLADWNLRDITGLGNYYDPLQTAARNQQSVRRWRELLDEKKIRLKTSDEKGGIGLRPPLSPPAAHTSGLPK